MRSGRCLPRHPQGTCEAQAGRARTGSHGLHDAAGPRIEPNDRRVRLVRHPDRALAEGDGRWAVADSNWVADNLVRVGVDARDRAAKGVRNPDIACAKGDPRRPVADADCVSKLVRIRVDAGDAVRVGARDPDRVLARCHAGGVGRVETSSSIDPLVASTMPSEFALSADSELPPDLPPNA